jgi:hypothetical protein
MVHKIPSSLKSVEEIATELRVAWESQVPMPPPCRTRWIRDTNDITSIPHRKTDQFGINKASDGVFFDHATQEWKVHDGRGVNRGVKPIITMDRLFVWLAEHVKSGKTLGWIKENPAKDVYGVLREDVEKITRKLKPVRKCAVHGDDRCGICGGRIEAVMESLNSGPGENMEKDTPMSDATDGSQGSMDSATKKIEAWPPLHRFWIRT